MSPLRRLYTTLIYMVVVALLIPFAVPAASAATVNKSIIGQVKLGANSAIYVKNVQLMPSKDKQTLTYTLEFVNNGSMPIKFNEYWTKVKLNGTSVAVKLTNFYGNKSEITPKSSAQYTFTATVNRSVKLSDVQIQLIKWDFSVVNYTRILGTVKIPSSYYPENNLKVVFVDDTKLSVYYKDFKTYNIAKQRQTEFNVQFTNMGYNTVNLPNYKYYFITPDKYVYELTRVTTEEVKVQPKAKVSLPLKLTLPEGVVVTSGTITVAYADEQTKTELPLLTSSVKIPKSTSSEVVVVDDTKLSVAYSDFKTYKLNDQSYTEFNVQYTNLGYKTVTLPNYKYSFITSGKYVYELTRINTNEVKVQPKAKASVPMKLTLPEGVNITSGTITISTIDEQTKSEIPLLTTIVKIPQIAKEDPSITLGVEKPFTVNDASYAIRLDEVKQLQLENENIVTATLSILNKTSGALAIPELVPTFYVDGVAVSTDKVKRSQLTGGVGVPANGSIQIVYYITTPLNVDIGSVQLELNSQIKTDGGETLKEKITTYSVPRTLFKGYDQVAVGKEISVVNGAKTTGYKIYGFESYEGSNAYLYNVLLEVQNKGNRAVDPNKILAYLKTQNGNYYPLKVSEFKDKINPGGKVLLSLSARIPNSSNTNSLKVVLGELIDEQNYLSAAEFDLPPVTPADTTSGLKNLAIYPYKLNINTITIELDRNANVTFQYELSKLDEFDSIPQGHSIIMELVDKDTSYSKEFKFESDLELGTHLQKMVAEMGIDNPNLKLMQMDGVKINIYDQYEGYKKLLGSRMVYAIQIK